MIPLDGRALHGLDEFMLRIGHLTVACQTALETSGSAFRFAKAFSEKLTDLVPVPGHRTSDVIQYLAAKRLAPLESDLSQEFDPTEFRYPDVVIEEDGGALSLRVEPPTRALAVTWQDLCLSADQVPSRVGSVTVTGKRGSKTGASHIIDWAQLLGLLTSSCTLTTDGQLLAKRVAATGGEDHNPYVPGNERFMFAYLAIGADFDVFARLVERLVQHSAPIRKADATAIYVQTIQALADEAERSRTLSQRQRHHLLGLWRDLRSSGSTELGATSTAWHRAASRFETYVDLGLLSKQGAGAQRYEYEYKYLISESLRGAWRSISTASSAEGWLDDHLAPALFGPGCSAEVLPAEELISFLHGLIQHLARPTSPLPISTLAIGLVWATADARRPMTLRAAKRSIEQLASDRPDVARLSTGATRTAEYVSIRLPKGEASAGVGHARI